MLIRRYKPLFDAILGVGITVLVFALAVDLLAILLGAKELLLILLICLGSLLVVCAIKNCFGKANSENI